MMMMVGSLALACWRLRDYQAESDWTAVTGRVIFITVILKIIMMMMVIIKIIVTIIVMTMVMVMMTMMLAEL